MTWRPVSDSTEDTRAYCFFESFIKDKSFITPEKQIVDVWRQHSHAANEIMVTHFWDGDDAPAEFPSDRRKRVYPLGHYDEDGIRKIR